MSTTKLPPRPERRGAGARIAGTFDDRAHYLPVSYQLRLLRSQAGLDQRQLARLTEDVAAREVGAAAREGREPRWKKGLSAYTINRYESGFHSPVDRSARLLAQTLSEALTTDPASPVVVTAEDLRVRDAQGLASFLRRRQGNIADADFWGALGIPVARAKARLAGTAPWTADELGAVAIEFPLAANAARDVMIEQARKRRGLPAYRRFATRDTGHPDYVPPGERRGRDDAQIAP